MGVLCVGFGVLRYIHYLFTLRAKRAQSALFQSAQKWDEQLGLVECEYWWDNFSSLH